MLIPVKELLEESQKEKYAVPQFNIGCFEVFRAVVETAGKLRSPIILGTSEKEMHFLHPLMVVRWAEWATKEFDIPIGLHLDHAQSLKVCLESLAAGYTSVHIDGSTLPFDENVALTISVARAAHGIGASCEGEIGGIKGSSEIHKENYEEIEKNIEFTDPVIAQKFVEETGVDSLAIAIGNVHGIYKTPPKLNFDLLKGIKEKVNLPLVLHGGSGILESDIKKAISFGICKVNVNTELRFAYRQGWEKVLQKNPSEVKPYNLMPKVIKEIEKIVEAKINLFGSAYKV